MFSLSVCVKHDSHKLAANIQTQICSITSTCPASMHSKEVDKATVQNLDVLPKWIIVPKWIIETAFGGGGWRVEGFTCDLIHIRIKDEVEIVKHDKGLQ